MTNYLQTVEEVYAQAAQQPDDNLCCAASGRWHLPGLEVPPLMLAMNYGCGSTVDPRDLRSSDTILYVGVGGGLEALQFAYFTRRVGSVVAVDPVKEMREKAQENFRQAALLNPWFQPGFVNVLDGNALSLPVADSSVTVVAQNCLFNVFHREDLEKALQEVVRVLRPGGFFASSDPISPGPLPAAFRADEVQRARCLSGCQTLADYLGFLTNAGFGRVEVRARFPYRYLTPHEFPSLTNPVLLESIEVVAYKVPDGPDGPSIFTGRTAIYTGPEESWTDEQGYVFRRGQPLSVSEGVAQRLKGISQFCLTEPTFHARPGGCC
jgi:SAM-dependent methyltransferase